jgi:hypothetical protein
VSFRPYHPCEQGDGTKSSPATEFQLFQPIKNDHSSHLTGIIGEEPWQRGQHGRRSFKDTNPLMSSSLVILFGAVNQFCRFRIWSETKCKTPAEYGPQYISTTPPPPTVTHCLFILYFGKGGGGLRRSERRYSRGATVHKYSSFIHGGQQFTSWVENTNYE